MAYSQQMVGNNDTTAELRLSVKKILKINFTMHIKETHNIPAVRRRYIGIVSQIGFGFAAVFGCKLTCNAQHGLVECRSICTTLLVACTTVVCGAQGDIDRPQVKHKT